MEKASGKFSDREIVEGIRSSRHDVLKYLYEQYYPMVYKMVIKNNGHAEEARDLFQEGILTLIEKARKPDFQLTSKLSTFLYAICIKLWLNKLNRQKNREDLHGDVPDIEVVLPDKSRENSEETAILQSLLQKLSESCQKILRMRFYEKRKDKEIAERLNLSGADYVKTQRYRCLSQLKKLYRTTTL